MSGIRIVHSAVWSRFILGRIHPCADNVGCISYLTNCKRGLWKSVNVVVMISVSYCLNVCASCYEMFVFTVCTFMFETRGYEFYVDMLQRMLFSLCVCITATFYDQWKLGLIYTYVNVLQWYWQ